jgi:hypothetical protein
METHPDSGKQHFENLREGQCPKEWYYIYQ